MSEILSILCQKTQLQWEHFFKIHDLWRGGDRQLLTTLKDLGLQKQYTPSLLKECEGLLRKIRSFGGVILHPKHSAFPVGFHNVYRPPVFLHYQGCLSLLQQKSLGVVGAREPLAWVEKWMHCEFLEALKMWRPLVVSGGARGVDQLSHHLALRAQAHSLAILPSGLGFLYPKTLEVFRRFVEEGSFAFLSEYLPETSIRKYHFYRRNRLIAGFSKSLFIVQAQKKSGTMITARAAIEQGKNVLCLVSDPMEVKMTGNLDLLYDGASMVRWKSDFNSSFF